MINLKTLQDKISEVKAVLRRCGFYKVSNIETKQGLLSFWHNGKITILLWEYAGNNGYEIYKPLTEENSHSNVLELITYL